MISEGFKDGYNYSIEAAFYLNNRNALVANLLYNPATYYYTEPSYSYYNNTNGTGPQHLLKYENIGVSSSYRYHFLQNFLPLYAQAGIGITRKKPDSNELSREYEYTTSLLLSVGANFNIEERIVISPFIAYNLTLDNYTYLLQFKNVGFNEFDLGVKIGYRF